MMSDVDEKKPCSFDPTACVRALAKRREVSAIRQLQPFLSIPGMVSLGAGNPNSGEFPIAALSMRLKDGSSVELSQSELDAALQYGPTPGLEPLLTLLRDWMDRLHLPVRQKLKDWDIVVTTGSQDGFDRVFDMLLDEGDSIFVERPTYSGAFSPLMALNAHIVSIPADDQGMMSDALEYELTHWSRLHPRHRVPRVVYVIPTGCNPRRKKEILRIARDWNLIVIEDDPYYFMGFDDDDGKGEVKSAARVRSSDGLKLDAAWKLEPSLFSMDTEGPRHSPRLVQQSAFCGFVTAHPKFIERIVFHMMAGPLSASGVSQMMAFSILNKWQLDGFLKQVQSVRRFYQKQRNLLQQFAAQELGSLARWTQPRAGMFVWFELLGVDDTMDLITTKARDAKVLMVPGAAFTATCTCPESHSHRSDGACSGAERKPGGSAFVRPSPPPLQPVADGMHRNPNARLGRCVARMLSDALALALIHNARASLQVVVRARELLDGEPEQMRLGMQRLADVLRQHAQERMQRAQRKELHTELGQRVASRAGVAAAVRSRL